MSEEQSIFRPGFQIYTLPLMKEVWQFAVFVIGHDRWQEDPEDHDSYEQVTWYIQVLFWQFSYTREVDYEHER